MSITFSKGTLDTVTIEEDPQSGYDVSIRRQQSIGRTAGGTVYVYERGNPYEVWSFDLVGLSKSERDDLESFFSTTVEGALNTFSYTDEDGTSHTARFLQSELPFSRTVIDAWSVRIELEIS